MSDMKPSDEAVEMVARAIARQAAERVPFASNSYGLWVEWNWEMFIPDAKAAMNAIAEMEAGG